MISIGFDLVEMYSPFDINYEIIFLDQVYTCVEIFRVIYKWHFPFGFRSVTEVRKWLDSLFDIENEKFIRWNSVFYKLNPVCV